MNRLNTLVIVLIFLHSCCGELSVDKKKLYVKSFMDHFNNLPGNNSFYDGGIFLKATKKGDNIYSTEVRLKEFQPDENAPVNYLTCRGDIIDDDSTTVFLVRTECDSSQPSTDYAEETVPPVTEARGPVQLDNEIQPSNAYTSGEQFIAVRRDNKVPCSDCSSPVNVDAPGVDDLAHLSVKQLDKYEPTVRHTINTIISVERVVQITTGVRYNILLTVDYNSCDGTETEACAFQKTCSVGILRKPWKRLYDGSIYKAVVANNCTKQWLFGDDGEVLDENVSFEASTANDGLIEDDIKELHHSDVQAQPTKEKTLTSDQLAELEEQIIPHTIPTRTPGTEVTQPERRIQASDAVSQSGIETVTKTTRSTSQTVTETTRPDSQTVTETTQPTVQTVTEPTQPTVQTVTETTQPTVRPSQLQPTVKKAQVLFIEDVEVPNKPYQVSTSIPETTTEKEISKTSNHISADKKKAVDELLNFFDFAGYSPIGENKENLRVKRDYGTDLRMMALAEQFENMKKKLENAKFVTSLSQLMVNYLNKMDTQVTTRILKDVIAVEEEYENSFHYFYIQARVAVPCDSVTCKNEYTSVQVCNGFIYLEEGGSPSVVSAFCFDDKDENQVKSKLVKKDDPILLKLVHDAMRKIENESNVKSALRLKKIDSAKTTRAVGILTKITAEFEYLDCDKEVPLIGRPKCSLSKLGSKVCDIEIHEKKLQKQRTVKYVCIERPTDEIFPSPVEKSSTSNRLDQENVTNPEILRIVKDDVNDHALNKINTPLTFGRQKEEDINDPHFTDLAEKSLRKYIQSSGTNQHHKIVKIQKVTTQVVSGTRTNILFTISPTNCKLNTNGQPTSSHCEIADDSYTLECHSEIWDRTWLNETNIIVNCNPAETRNKRQIPGGQLEKDSNDSKYKELAEESMAKYLQSIGSTQAHNIVKVEKVTTQVVSGIATSIDFKISPANDPTRVLQCHSRIWEQSWLNKKEITVNCDPAETRNKRQIPGGQLEKESNDPKYKELAEESMAKYLQSIGSTQAHNIVKVEKVTTQVVSGIATSIDFKISPANDPTRVLQCHSRIWEQSWLNKKEITVNCDPAETRNKRQIPGGQLEKDSNDPKYKELAEESMAKYLQSIGSTQAHNIVKVEKVTTQVVSGRKTLIDFMISPVNDPTKILKCHSEIWEQPWLNKKEITVNCDPAVIRNKRQLVGGQSEADPNRPEYRKLAEESMAKYLETVGSTQTHNIVKVEKVTTQVVSGIAISIDFKISPANDPTRVLQCHSRIWEQSWLNKKEITVNCDPAETRNKRQIPGGLLEKDTNDPKYKELAEESMAKYLQSIGSTQAHNIVKVEKVTTQVVSGRKTLIDFMISPVNDPTKILKCHSEIWEQPWLNKKEITVNCDPAVIRNKRQLVGGQSEADPNRPEYRKLAEESMAKYLETVGSTQTHNIVKVEKVTTQVVSGFATSIDFKISPANDPTRVLQCHSRIWEQSWLNKKEITVNCDPAETRNKRQIPGGQLEADPNRPEYLKLAEESMAKYLETVGSTQTHNIVKVEKVTTQVVSGIATSIDFKISPANDPTRVLQCHSRIWEQSWLNKKEITVNCDPAETRNKRQIPGGQLEKDSNDPKYKELAEESVAKYLQSIGSTQAHNIVKVEKVTSQVVSGRKTLIDFKISPVNDPTKILQCHSEIWEQPWLNKKEITVNCDPAVVTRNKRKIKGGQSEKDPNDPEYRKLAEESMAKYLETVGSTQAHNIVKVEKVTTQVVSGSATSIDFKISPANDPTKVLQCHSRIWEQSWLNKKEITVNCDPAETRNKRQLVGGQSEADPNRPEYRKLAEESMAKYLETVGSTQTHNIVKVEKVTTQVVSGIAISIDFKISPANDPTRVLQCHSRIWEQSWLNKKEITVNCDPAETRNKRQIPGGQLEKDSNDPKYKELAEESMAKYLQSIGSTQAHNIVKVEKVTTQVVSGRKTLIDFKISPVNDPTKILQCHSEIWEQPWLNKKEITVNCDPAVTRKKRQIPGGNLEKDPNRPEYRKLAEESMAKYLETVGSTQTHNIVKVEKVVSGIATSIDFKISPANDPTRVLQCHSRIWEQPWLNKKEITVNCNPVSSKKKRQLIGGPTEVDSNKPEYYQLAEESMAKYLQTVGNTQKHKVLKVEKVTVQVVSGTITLIDFKISPENNPTEVLKCHSEIWEQSWLNKKEITVKCKLRKNKRKLAGEQTEKDPKDPKYKEIAQETMKKYVQTTGDIQYHKVTEVEKVTTQIVSGTLTQIDFKVSPTNCIVGLDGNPDNLNCKIRDPANVLKCRSKIWEQPLLKKREISTNCSPETSRRKREILRGNLQRANMVTQDDDRLKRSPTRRSGGREEVDPGKIEFQDLATESLRRYEKQKKSKVRHKLVKVHSVVTQVVSGMLYQIDFTAAPTLCPTSRQDVDKCEIDENVILNCHAEIWNRPWLKRKQIEVFCKVDESDDYGEEDLNNESRKKRSIDTDGHKTNTDEIHNSNAINALKEDLRKEYDIKAESKKREHIEEDYIEDEVKYYYADRTLSQINSRTTTQNLYKLVTIHDIRRSMHMRTPLVRMYVEIALTYCMKHVDEGHLASCIEIDGTNHELCLARLWPKFDNEFILNHDSVVCESDLVNFVSLTGFVRDELLRASVDILNRNPKRSLMLANVGETRLVPSLDYKEPLKLNFMIQPTNCTVDDLVQPDTDCLPNDRISIRRCLSEIYLAPHTRTIRFVNVSCTPEPRATRKKRSVTLNTANATEEEQHIQELVKETLEKLEMISIHRYKQRVLQINGYSNQITTGKMTKIDFDVGYTNCLKYEWVANISDCQFLEHLPRRHCVAFVWERLWVDNGRHIEVNCDEDETPLEANMGLETADITTELANEALKRIEYKYPHPQKQKVVRVFSLEKQTVAGLHYRMKMEVGFTDCMALTQEEKCKVVNDMGLNRFCRVNVWLRPWTEHPPSYRVTCDYADGATDEIYHLIQAEKLFTYFLATYRPDYLEDHAEMEKRFEIFKANVKKIHELNIYEMGTAKYGITRFADLTIEEFRSKHMGLKTSLRDENQVPMAQAEIPKVDLPKEFDWRKFDVVTEVKDQGLCGSCWAFSVTGNIEGQWKRHTGKLLSLSEQELVDCDSLDKGCDGGLPDNAYRAIEQLGGLETESDYPYEGVDDKCVFNRSLSRVQIKGAVNITSNETGMAQWLVSNGPISIGINANAMQFYMGGVSHPWKMLCSPKNLDHGVLIVGFGEADYPLFKKKLPYWIIKNSWGKGWGEQGYYRVFRGDGTCGVNQMASSAIV